MDMCRACGEFPDGTNQLSEYLEKYSDIYFNLTSIKVSFVLERGLRGNLILFFFWSFSCLQGKIRTGSGSARDVT